MKKIGILFLVFVLLFCLIACDKENNGGCDLEREIKAFVLPEKPNYGGEVSVHDPSVLKALDGNYYAFGSHFAVSKSKI